MEHLKRKCAAVRARWNGLRARLAGETDKRFFYYPSAWAFMKSGFPREPADVHPGSYLTFRPNHVARIGHQSAAWITAFNMAKALGLTFVHRPFTADWEEYLGFGAGEVGWNSSRLRGLRKVALPRFPGDLTMDSRHPLAHIIARESKKGPCLFYTEYDYAANDLSTVGKDLASKFFKKHPDLRPSKTDGRSLSVAFHVRRGDIVGLKDSRVEATYQRFLPESYYMQVAELLERELCQRPYQIHVYSDGRREDFQEMNKITAAIWHLDESAQETFGKLASADLLIMGRSGFSFLAGLINPGIKIAGVPWWHKIPEGPEWKTISIETTETNHLGLKPLVDGLV